MENKKVAVVTGAGVGIGKGIALALAKEGYDVVASDIDQQSCAKTAAEAASAGAGSLAVKCDVSVKAEVESLFSQTKERFGKVDVLVNNAGIYPFVSFGDMQEEDWDKVMGVNMKGLFLCSQEALRYMPEGGRIINISSIASLVGFPGLVHYCASKGGVNAMSRALALELAPKKITVNVVAPGAIKTPGAQSSEQAQQQIVAGIPLKRMGEPEDIAGAVSFLASEKASYVTGQTIVVDGGWTIQ